MQVGNHLDPLEKILAQKIKDKIEKVEKRNFPQVTDFLDPYQQRFVESYLKKLDNVTYITYGGYSGAERAKIAVMPKSWHAEAVNLDMIFLDVRGNFKFREVSHRDFLGAILALGLKREKIGDLILEENAAKVVVDSSAASFIINNLKQVNNVSVTVKEISGDEIAVLPEKVKDIRGTVASLRLDAVASLGFGYSRSKIANVIKADQVKLNWQRANDPSTQVKKGDVISFRGRGRIILADVLGMSKKGRVRVVLNKML